MLTVYGSPLCPDCRAFKTALDAGETAYTYVDITASMKNLKAFLKLRDSLPVFAPCKAAGSVGIPAIAADDGEVTLDWEAFLAEKGLPVFPPELLEADALQTKQQKSIPIGMLFFRTADYSFLYLRDISISTIAFGSAP